MIYVILCVMAAIILFLSAKLYLIKKAAREITNDLSKKIKSDTCTRLRISSRDKDIRRLASCINEQLDELHNERLQYHHGNIELKNAITNISHDIRTPLTAIYGYLDMLQKTDDPEKQQHYISVMKERTELMKQLTEELFRYSAIISDESDMDKEDVFVNQVLAESVSSFYPALSEKRIEPNILITEKRIVKNINRAALTRVFSNLLSNAVKYSDGDLEIKLDDSGEITFSNTAGGLSAVDTEQLFDRFYTVESAHNSTGLGLSIARTLTERMGGTIEAEYRDNRLIIKIKLV